MEKNLHLDIFITAFMVLSLLFLSSGKQLARLTINNDCYSKK